LSCFPVLAGDEVGERLAKPRLGGFGQAPKFKSGAFTGSFPDQAGSLGIVLEQ
jgi:hypothetical protein